MRTSFTRSIAAACAAALIWTPVVAQSGPSHRPFPPAGGAVAPVKRAVQDEASAAVAAVTTPVTGTFVAKFTIRLATAVPSGSEVLCTLNASVSDENKSTYTLSNVIYEGASTKAIVSGSTATCTVTLPYSWYLTNGSTDTAELTYYLYIINATATNQSGESRTSSQYVPGAGAIKIPATGATTTYAISATL